jgi:hypothetical protein
MARFNTFRDVIDAWPSRRDFADDIGVTLARVHKMHEKDAIRGVYFAAIVACSRERHGPESAVSADDLCDLAARVRHSPLQSEDAA